mgnify:CR=1 FL=1
MAKVNISMLALQEALADAIEQAFEDWEAAQARALNWDYPDGYPVISRYVPGRYAQSYRRPQQVVLCSRSVAHG